MEGADLQQSLRKAGFTWEGPSCLEVPGGSPKAGTREGGPGGAQEQACDDTQAETASISFMGMRTHLN
jgi:hypothetical protein